MLKKIKKLIKTLICREGTSSKSNIPTERDERKDVRNPEYGKMTKIATNDIKASKKRRCKRCMLYIADECIGNAGGCEFYKLAPHISEEEKELWPKEMGGAYGTLHKDRE